MERYGQQSMEISLTALDGKSTKSEEARAKKAHRRAIIYSSRYVDGDPSKLTNNELQFISTNLKFVRKFGGNYNEAI